MPPPGNDLLQNNKGMALLTALVVLFVLTTLSFLFYHSVFASYAISRSFADNIALRNLSLSGVYLAVATLAEDRHQSFNDTLQENWALLGKKKSVFSEKETATSLHIVDLKSRLSVDALLNRNGSGSNPEYAALFYHLLNNPPFELDTQNAARIVAALVDWQDNNDGEAVTSFRGQLGAESSYYESLSPPIVCRNKPIESLDQLLAIRGITKELLYGEKDKPGLAEFIAVTPAGLDIDPTININTAPREILRAVFANAPPASIDEMIAYRDDYPFQLEKKNWYSTFISSAASPRPGLIQIRSDLFEITAAAAKGPMKTEITTTVWREPNRFTFSSWRQR